MSNPCGRIFGRTSILGRAEIGWPGPDWVAKAQTRPLPDDKSTCTYAYDASPLRIVFWGKPSLLNLGLTTHWIRHDNTPVPNAQVFPLYLKRANLREATLGEGGGRK